MDIIISNEKERKRFFKLLPIYKSFLFRFVYFDVVTEDEHISAIIKALNIKKRRQRILFIYETACQYIDKYMQEKKFVILKKINV